MALRASLRKASDLQASTHAAAAQGRRAAGCFAAGIVETGDSLAAGAGATTATGATLRAAALGCQFSGVVAGEPHHAAPAVAAGAHPGTLVWAAQVAALLRHVGSPSKPRAPRRPRRTPLTRPPAVHLSDIGRRPAPPPPPVLPTPALLAAAPQWLLQVASRAPSLRGRPPRLVVVVATAPLFGVAAGMSDAAGWCAWQALAVRALFAGNHPLGRTTDLLGDEPRRRPKTMSRREMLRERRRRERAGELLEIAAYERPQTRADCIDGPRPCLFVACKHHLYLDVNPETGSIKINFPDRDVWDLEETCALDVAERGGVTLEEVGDILNLTRERVRQVEVTGLTKLKGDSPTHELDVFVGWDPHPDDG